MGRALVSVMVIGTCSLICRARENPDAVTLMGRVSGPDGAAIEDAGVLIVGRRLRTVTDANGVFRFAGVAPVEFPGPGGEEPAAVRTRQPAPILNGTRLLFGMESVENGSAYYSLSGRLMRRVPNTRWDVAMGPGGLRKRAGDADSLIVTAPGFVPARCEIQTFTGVLNFRLERYPASFYQDQNQNPTTHSVHSIHSVPHALTPASTGPGAPGLTSTQGAIPR